MTICNERWNTFKWESLQHANLILPQSNVPTGCHTFVFLHMPYNINTSIMILFGIVDFSRHIYVSFLKLLNGTASHIITPFRDNIFSQKCALLGLHMIFKKNSIIICFIWNNKRKQQCVTSPNDLWRTHIGNYPLTFFSYGLLYP